MTRLLRTMLVALAFVTVFSGQANAAPDEDFVVGTGTIAIPSPFDPLSTIPVDIVIDAHSDASGQNPTGTLVASVPPVGFVVFNGPVTCLAVTGDTALIGIEDATGPVTFEVIDNSATGTADTIGYVYGPAGCPDPDGLVASPLVSGDFMVHDALPLAAKDQCKLGGWRDFTDDERQPFASQGACIAFVQHVN